MISPLSLKKGDTIGLVAPARKINEQELTEAITIFESRGYQTLKSPYLFALQNQFAGSDKLRAADMQFMLENSVVKAVFAVRGGYGSVRIVDKINFEPLLQNPKWLVGYSDFTVFHNHLVNLGLQSLHATMPLNFSGNTPESLNTLFDTLEGKILHYYFISHPLNRNGNAAGMLVGGNLSVLYSLMGSRSFPDTTGRILFLEDVDEYLYHVDRMMMALKRAGILKNLAGLIIGGMTKMNDNATPFGKTAKEIIRESVEEYHFPIAFGFPSGHQSDNRTLIMGAEVHLEISAAGSTLHFN